MAGHCRQRAHRNARNAHGYGNVTEHGNEYRNEHGNEHGNEHVAEHVAECYELTSYGFFLR